MIVVPIHSGRKLERTVHATREGASSASIRMVFTRPAPKPELGLAADDGIRA